MTNWITRCLALLLLALPLAFAAAPPARSVERLVRQLGSDDFDERESASTHLSEIGEPAVPALHEALASADLEVRSRAGRLVAVLDKKYYGEPLRLTGHTGPLHGVSVSADGKRLLTCSSDKTLRLWDADTGKCLRVFEGHAGCIFGAALSPDGKRVLSCSGDNTVRLWDADTGDGILQMTPGKIGVSRVAFGPEGKAISGGYRTMDLWDLKTGKNDGVLTGHGCVISGVAYSDKARLAVTCSWDLSIRLWDLETGKERGMLTGHSKHITSACFSWDGVHLLSAADDNTVRVWDVGSGKELKRITVEGVGYAAFSPDGKRIVCAGFADNTMRVWDVAAGKELRKYEGHTAYVGRVAFFPDGRRIASASEDGTARIWRAPR